MNIWSHLQILGLDIVSSLGRVLCGSLLGACLGILLSIVRFRLPLSWQKNLLVQFLFEAPKYPPPIAWIPFAILFFGISSWTTIAIVVVGVTPIVFTQSYDALRAIPLEIRQITDSLELPAEQKIFRIYLPNIRPQLFTSFRLAFNMGWMCIIAAEMISASSGLGYGIQLGRMNLDYLQLWVYVGSIGAIGFILQRLLLKVEKKWVPWSIQFQHEEIYDSN